MNIQEQVQTELNALIDNGKVQEIIREQLQSTIKGIFNNTLREYSEFGKQLQLTVNEALKIDLTKMSLLSYQQIVTDIVKEQLELNLLKHVNEPISKALEGVIGGFEKRSYKLSEIVEKYKELEIEESEGELTLIVEHSSYGSVHVHLDEKSGKRAYDCEYRFSLDKKDKKIYSFDIGRNGSQSPMLKSIHGAFSKFIFNLYASQSTIEVDEYECETSWYND